MAQMRLAVTVAVCLAASNVPEILAQEVAPPPSTGVADCDEYYGMVAACLPRMCETERALVELDLSFNREVLSKVIELKGREAAAEGCVQDALKEIQNDPYGCYEAQRAPAGLPAARIRVVRIAPTASAVTISFESDGEPGMSYCFSIESPTGEERRGTFTTSAGH